MGRTKRPERTVPMAETDRERREFIRVPFRTEVAVRTKDRTLWANSTLDISLNGLRISTNDRPPEEGTTCEIEIVLSDADPAVIIEARGTVVRPEPGILAEQVVEPGPEGRKRAASYRIDVGRCLYCGLCAEVCPVEAVVLTRAYELVALDRSETCLDKDALLERGRGL